VTKTEQRPLNLEWGLNTRRDGEHYEWNARCGCAYHPEPSPHVHYCETHRSPTVKQLVDALVEAQHFVNKLESDRYGFIIYLDPYDPHRLAAAKIMIRAALEGARDENGSV